MYILSKFSNMINYFNESDLFIKFIGKFNICILAVLVGFMLIKSFNLIIDKTFAINKKISDRKRKTLTNIFKSGVRYVVYFFVFCQFLTAFGIDIVSIIAVASVGSIAIAFGAQTFVQDVISGMFILLEDQFGIGDIITVDNLTGTVENLGIRTCTLRSADGNLHIIPNGQIRVVTNMSKDFNRAIIDILVNYEEDTEKVINILRDELKTIYDKNEIFGILNPPQVLGITSLKENYMEIRISIDSTVGENWAIEREIRRHIKNRFDKENIKPPHPKTIIKNEN